MKHFLTLPLLLVLTIAINTSCKKDIDAIVKEKIIIKEKSGIIRNFGNVAADGCGWVVEIDGHVYSPVNLASTYQVDNLEVVLSYKLTGDKFDCGFNIDVYDNIHIEAIRLK